MANHPKKTPQDCVAARRAHFFDDMAGQLYVDLEKAANREGGEAIARARKRCADCKETEECEGWLNASFGLPLPPSFCPNAPFFHLCIADGYGAADDTD